MSATYADVGCLAAEIPLRVVVPRFRFACHFVLHSKFACADGRGGTSSHKLVVLF